MASEYPHEACGFVHASGVRTCRNVVDQLREEAPAEFDRTARTGYALGFADLRYLHESLAGPDPVRVVYHSHPDVGAYFSAEDQRWAVLDGQPVNPVDHLVVDVRAAQARGAALFAFDSEAEEYVEIAWFGWPRPGGRRPRERRA